MVPPTEQRVVGEIDPGDDVRRAKSDLLRLGKVVVDAVSSSRGSSKHQPEAHIDDKPETQSTATHFLFNSNSPINLIGTSSSCKTQHRSQNKNNRISVSYS